ncbi:hypothetical protein CRE_03096 [Caenorhabditis remanei]|uniref:Skp1-related protein n=1 Tax=Caenorhabditis remanei TaxID=31234 RepID=E3LWI5_CAERE|nr:hypothetical protein CRE_03096 [Caenorhabditis remanei]
MSAEEGSIDVPSDDAPDFDDTPEVEDAPVNDAGPEADDTSEVDEVYYITLISMDQQEVRMSSDALCQSKALLNAVDGLQRAEKQLEVTVQIAYISGTTLTQIVEWCEQHKGEPIPVEEESEHQPIYIPQWDKEFLDGCDLNELLPAAFELQIKRLLDYGCKAMALITKGKSLDELRDVFGIENDEEEDNEAAGLVN